MKKINQGSSAFTFNSFNNIPNTAIFFIWQTPIDQVMLGFFPLSLND